MLIDLQGLSPNRVYFTLIQTLIPRPVAWVLSDSGDGGLNLAPFSYFNAVCSDPPLLMLSIGKKADGSLKDSRRNIVERGHFVIHIAHRELLPALNASSAELPVGCSEVEVGGLETVPFGEFPLPRLADCRVAYGCKLFEVVELGPLPQAMILGRVEVVHIDDSVIEVGAQGRFKVDARRLDPISRLGGDEYGLLGEVVTLPRPR
jgi:flavin reductase (DIM6/NTAB) family NADH-FMN oxidoreductase RutF